MGFLERAADAFDLPSDIVAGLAKVTVTGDRVLVENHHGILEYGDEEIHINGGRIVLKIYGRGLELRAMNSDELLIVGRISRIEFDD